MKNIEIKLKELDPEVRNKCITFAKRYKYEWTSNGVKPFNYLRFNTKNKTIQRANNRVSCYLSNWILLNPELPADYEIFKDVIKKSTKGKDLVKIPEYVECIDTVVGIEVGKIYPVIEGKYGHPDVSIMYDWFYNTKPSTLEAYEAQESKNEDDLSPVIKELEKRESQTPSLEHHEQTIKQLEHKNKLLESCNADNLKTMKEMEEQIKNLSECSNGVDKVTLDLLQKVLYSCGIFICPEILDRVIDAIDLIADKGDDVSLKDISEMEACWSTGKQEPIQ